MFFLRIFKHRGDIYIPAAKIKSDLEQRILISILVFIVAFTVVFVALIGFKYDFSFKKFFAPDVEVSAEINETVNLPSVSGKTNYLFIMNNSETDEIYCCSLIQVDMDSVSYKVCTLDAETVVENKKLSDIYLQGGAGNVVNAVSSLIGISIDYYIDESTAEYKKMFDALGSVNYTVLSDIRYKDTSTYGFNIKIKEGSQTISGDTASKLIRYYMAEKNYDIVNEIILTSLTQQINSDNYNKKEKLFTILIENSSTNITITDYNQADDALKVLSNETTGANVYSVTPVYKDNVIESSSVNNIIGYFTK